MAAQDIMGPSGDVVDAIKQAMHGFGVKGVQVFWHGSWMFWTPDRTVFRGGLNIKGRDDTGPHELYVHGYVAHVEVAGSGGIRLNELMMRRANSRMISHWNPSKGWWNRTCWTDLERDAANFPLHETRLHNVLNAARDAKSQVAVLMVDGRGVSGTPVAVERVDQPESLQLVYRQRDRAENDTSIVELNPAEVYLVVPVSPDGNTPTFDGRHINGQPG